MKKFHNITPAMLILVPITVGLLYACSARDHQASHPNTVWVPVIEGQWWQVAGNPDLGELQSPGQQPVDFGLWQARDGTWQLWSCIRKTKERGMTRLFYRWEGKSITDVNWEPMGIAMRADSTYGETPGGLQAPYVFIHQDEYQMFYGDWKRICLARSRDGKEFERVIVDGSPALFGDPQETNTRDAMVVRGDDRWYCYYTAHPDNDGAIYVRTSEDLHTWSNSKKVSYGGSAGKGELWFAECPHVVVYEPGIFYLFRTYSYGTYQSGKLIRPPATNVYRSDNPWDFGIDTDSMLVTHLPVAAPEIVFTNDQWYIASLMPDLQGIRIARLSWRPLSEDD